MEIPIHIYQIHNSVINIKKCRWGLVEGVGWKRPSSPRINVSILTMMTNKN